MSDNPKDFKEWLVAVREAGNFPISIVELLDEWPNFPDEYLRGTIKNDKTVAYTDVKRAAQYADFNPEYTESSVQEITDEDYRQAYYGDSSYGSGTFAIVKDKIEGTITIGEIEDFNMTIEENDIEPEEQ